jgi:CRISPR/Cas system CSM-associated protein Csm3 (group 7 of RAMP superfamily)
MIFRVEDNGEESEKKTTYPIAYDLAWKVKDILENGITLGAKSTVGFGKMDGKIKIFELDFNNPLHFEHWINNTLTFNEITKKEQAITPNVDFTIDGNFRIKNSLIIRSYSSDPSTPDATHLKSGGRNILSGSSVKGALRARAERILNTLGYGEDDFTSVFIAGLFGDVEKETGSKSKVKKDGYTVPSRVFVEEIQIDDDTVKEEIQTRIQIDQFTGGTVDGALIEEVPLFSVKDTVQIKHLRIRIVNPTSSDKGLMLLLLKDLWTADLPIGGEKAIGRGVLEGINATIMDEGTQYDFPDVFKDPVQLEKLQGYVNSLKENTDSHVYAARVEQYNIRKNEK